MLQRRAGEVGDGAHHQQVRQAIAVELAHGVFDHGQGLVMGGEGAAFVHRGQLHADVGGIDLIEHRFDHLEQDAGAAFQPAAIGVGAAVGGAVEELGDQVEVVGLDLHPVEAGLHGVAGGAAVVGDGLADLLAGHGSRRDGGLAAAGRHRQLLRVDVGGRDGQGAVAQLRMRHGAGVPELGDDAPAGRVHRIRHPAPAADLLSAPQARRVGPAEALGADGDGLRNDQAGRGALGVVLGLERGRDLIVRTGPHPGQRRHDDAVGQVERAHAGGSEQRLDCVEHELRLGSGG